MSFFSSWFLISGLLSIITFFSFFSASHLFFSRNIVYTILSLIFIFFLSAVFLFLLNFHFFSIIYVLVYIGAIAVFFLFILLLLDLREEDSWYSHYRESPSFSYFSLIVVCLFLSCWFFISYTILNFVHIWRNGVFVRLSDLTLLNGFFLFDLWFNADIIDLKFFEWTSLSLLLKNDLFSAGYALYTYFFFLLNLVGFVLFIAMFCSINLFLGKR